jgi:HEPN pEK499 p136
MRLASRNEWMGFANRTKKNLEHIQKAFDAGHDVHVVTQIVNSLLGLVVFPWESHLDEVVKAMPLSELERQGWPRWEITKGSCATLGELIHHLRNGAAHQDMWFSSDDRDAGEVTIELRNRKKKRAPEPYLVARLNADEVQEFCLRFISLVEDTVG